MKGNLAIILLLVIVSVIAPSGVASAANGGSQCSGEAIEGVLTRTDENLVRVSLTTDTVCKSGGFRLPSSVKVHEMKNLKKSSNKYKIINPSKPAVIEYFVSSSIYYTVTDEWGFVPTPSGDISITEVKPDGVVFPSTAFIGEYSTYTNTSGTENITVYVPESIDGKVNGEKISAVTTRIATDFPTKPNGEYEMVVVPELKKMNGLHINGVSVVETRENKKGVYLTIYHEYIHSQQKFGHRLTDEMQWFTEASATYLATEYAIEHGYINEGYWNLMLANTENGQVLTNSSTWVSRDTPYIRGALVLESLDRKGVNVEGIMIEMNTMEMVSYTEFTGLVKENGETNTTVNWMNSHIRSGAFLTEPFSFTPVKTIFVSNMMFYPMTPTAMFLDLGASFLIFSVVLLRYYRLRFSFNPESEREHP